MTTNATNADDYSDHVSNAESVTFTARRTSGNTSVTVAGALGIGLSVQEQIAAGINIQTDVKVWHLPDKNMSGKTVRPGDTITQSDGTVWHVSRASLQTFSSRWECLTTKGK